MSYEICRTEPSPNTALTPEEWDEMRDPGACTVVGLLQSEAVECVARANFFLPATDPRKITRNDAMLLLGTPLHPGCTPDLSARIDQIAHKLLALLPPE